jgi:hypothetical protein
VPYYGGVLVVVEDTVIVEDTSHTTVLEEYLVERVVMEDTVDTPYHSVDVVEDLDFHVRARQTDER